MHQAGTGKVCRLEAQQPQAAFDTKNTKCIKVYFLQLCLLAGGWNDPDMLVVGLDGMTAFGVPEECPEHIEGCQPGTFISRERWGTVSCTVAAAVACWEQK